MNLNDIPLFSMMKGRMSYITQREKLIAQNVANADTPGYAPKDLKAFSLRDAAAGGGGGKLQMAQPVTTGGASQIPLTPASAAVGQWKTITTADSETKLDGNKVELEDQMSKMTQSRLDYEAVIGFYQKSLEMLRLAATPPK